jgi:uncharacterized protein (TIGR02466 family)
MVDPEKVSADPTPVPLVDGDRPMAIAHAFPTYVGLKDWNGIEDVADINARLRRAIYRKQGEDKDGIYRSNAAGTWHSDTELLKWIDVPELAKLFHNSFASYATTLGVSPAAQISFKLQAWAMVYSDRGYATVHTHPNCHFSGVYYLDNGDDDVKTMVTGAKAHPGDIEFVDGRPASGYQFPGVNFLPAFRLRPRAGELIVFPSWLPHFVHPVRGNKDRICIAANATIVNIKNPEGTKE